MVAHLHDVTGRSEITSAHSVCGNLPFKCPFFAFMWEHVLRELGVTVPFAVTYGCRLDAD